MKKIAVILFSVLLTATAISQPLVQASIGVGSTPNSIKIYLKPASAVNGIVSSLQYTVGLPSTVSPVPTLSIVSTSLLSGFSVDPPFLDPIANMYMYDITTAIAGVNITIPAAETEAMELKFSGGTNIPTNVSLATPGLAGITGNELYLFTGAAGMSVSGNLYYLRGGTSVTNNDSYNLPLNSTATITGVVLPVKLTDFVAVKRNRDGLLTWNLQNQDILADHFEIERSFNGIDFTKIGRTEAIANAGGTVSYNYNDINIDALKATTGIVYYHIKSVDKNGGTAFTEVRSLRLSDKMINVNLYPNPATTYTNLSYDLPEASAAIIKVIDPSGKEVMATEVQAQKGLNRQRINVSNYASGKYIVTIKTATETQNISFMKGN